MSSTAWKVRTLSEIVSGLDAGVSVNADDRLHGVDEVGVLKTSAVYGGVFKSEEHKAVWRTERRRVRTPVEADSIIVSRMNTPDLVGESAYVPAAWPDLYLPDRLWLLRFANRKAISVRWLSFLLAGHSAKTHAKLNATGTSGSMKSLPKDRFLEMQIRCPPVEEQYRIAEIIDSIDDAVLKSERVISKLQQVQQGLLHDLLTRGIDENGVRRDPRHHPEQFRASVLGHHPVGWEVLPLGARLDGIDAGKSPNLPGIPAQPGEWGVLKVSAVRPEGFQPSENKVCRNRWLVNPAYEVKHGDLLISRANTAELVGLTCLVDTPPPRLLLCDKTLRLRVSTEADPEYVFYASQMAYVRCQIEVSATGSSGSMKNIGQSSIRSLMLLFPSFSEQRRIVRVLRAGETRINLEECALLKLRAVKQGLMADLLTGRVGTLAGRGAVT